MNELNIPHLRMWTGVLAGVAVVVILWQHATHTASLVSMIQGLQGGGETGQRASGNIYPQLDAARLSPDYHVGRSIQAAATAAIGYPV